MIAFIDVLKGVDEHVPVMVILENGFFLIPAGGHMVDSTCVPAYSMRRRRDMR